MFAAMKKTCALLLTLVMLVAWLPLGGVQAAEAEPAQEVSADAYAEVDLVFDQIDAAHAAPDKKNDPQDQKTQTAMEIVTASESYAEGSLVRSGNAFTWWTDTGIHCAYSPRMNKINSQLTPETGVNEAVNEPKALKGGSPAGNQVYLIGPYYGYDENFSNQYKNEARRVASAIGDADGYTLYSGTAATVDKVAEAVSNGAVVFFDSHGSTDYENPSNEYDFITGATSSYLCLTSTSGLTSEDYADGALYYSDGIFINGATIANHMTKNSPSGLLWMAICLGMGTDAMYKPLMEKGVSVVYGYSESVTFAGDYLFEEAFWDEMIQGKTVAQAAAAMKSTWGNWDWSTQIAEYYGYTDGYSTIAAARADFSAFPVVTSAEDAHPGQRTGGTNYGADSLQTVNSTYTLGEVYEVTDPTDPRQILEEAYALGANEELPYSATLTGTITAVTTAYSTQYQNVTVIMEVAGCEDMPIKCYRMQGSGADQIGVGDTITVSGTIVNYQHSSGDLEVEFKQGCTLVSWESGAATPTDPATEPTETPSVPEVEYTVSFAVPQGVDAVADMICTGSGITLPEAASPSEDYTFVGWATESISTTETKPTLYTGTYVAESDVTLYAVYAAAGSGSGSGAWTLVTDASTLTAGTQLILAANAQGVVAGDLSGAYLSKQAATFSADKTTITQLPAEAMIFTLGGSAGAWTLNNANGQALGATAVKKLAWNDGTMTWSISVADSAATVQNATASYGRMLYNVSSPRFTTYTSSTNATMVLPQLYAMSGSYVYTSNPVACEHTNTEEIPAVAPSCTEPGSTAGVYCPDCQIYLTSCEVIPALGHDYEAVVTPPTVTEGGYTTHTCSVCGDSYQDSFTEALGETYTVSFVVPAGVAAVEAMACNNAGIQLPAAGVPEGGSYTFFGWATESIAETEEAPTVYKADSVFYANGADQTLYAVYTYTEGGSAGSGDFMLVTDAAQLTQGAEVIIAANTAKKAMSKTQNGNNRASATITLSENSISSYGSDVAILTLQAGLTDGTWAFYDNGTTKGYLYAASSSKNYLRTESTLSANSSWNITVTDAGVATVKATGSNTHNWMRYNTNNGTPIFSCYASGQQDINLYVKSAGGTTYYTSLADDGECDHILVDGLCTLCQKITDGEDYYATMAEAADNANYLKLVFDVTEDVTLSSNVTLDLNGRVFTGDIVVEDGYALKLYDTATADYTAENRGKIVGNIEGNLVRVMNTPSFYGHNYKYLTLQETDGSWSAHRVYLSVKSATLVPQLAGADTAVSYKTVFKCSDLVASYVTAYGAQFTGDNTVSAPYDYAVAGGANEGVAWLTGTLSMENTDEVNAANAVAAPTVSAYITLEDGFTFASAGVTKSLQELVVYANGLTTLSDIQKSALGAMYAAFQTVMDAWTDVNIDNIKAYAEGWL